ncbi:hypothetical protein FK216_04570 [Moraxellaceae bacterium AER2_44_116]|nr:hypothetical protein [Moraxellaceae bacterium]TQC98802.1 hypothetical protein FK216_04570 [Moraxellaceae bacterium AER2_44_116]
MKLLWLTVLLSLTACSTQHSNTKPTVKVDYCLSEKESNDYINSHFTKPLEVEINTTDPSGTSVLVSAAINGRLGDTVAAKSVSAHVLDVTHGSPILSFVDIQNIIAKVGFQATEFQGTILDEMRQFKNVMALSTDREGNLVLLLGVENDVVYTLYPESKICLMDYATLSKKYKPKVLMVIDRMP